MNSKHLKSIVTAYIFLFVVFFTGCGGTSSEKVLNQGFTPTYDEFSVGKIKGIVRDSSTGMGIAGAIVEAYQCQAITGSDGSYLLEKIPAGDHKVTVRLPGYNAEYLSEIRVYAGKETENINFVLSSASNSYSKDFEVLTMNPQWGTDGDTITLLCRGCGITPGRVTFNGADASIVDWNSAKDGYVKVRLPNNVESGPVRLIINGEQSKEQNPLYFIAKPVILGVHPDIATGGAKIVISGRNFSNIYSRNKFQLNGEDCYTIEDESSIYSQKIILPASPRTGKITVKLVEKDKYIIDGIGSAVLTIAPRLTYMTPRRSMPGAPITLYGYNFGADLSAFKILVGTYEVNPSDITSFSDTSVTFKAPSNSIIGAGLTVEVKVQVNNAVSNGINYTAYNDFDVTIKDYGIYDFADVSKNNKLRLAQLKPNDVIAFISTLSGPHTQRFLDDSYSYVVCAKMGGNDAKVPDLPASVRAAEYASRFVLGEQPVVSRTRNFSFPITQPSPNARLSMGEPASETITVFVRDFTKESPFDAANDIEQVGIIGASSTHAIVYLEESLDSFTKNSCIDIAESFDSIYDALKDEFGVLEPPEGNVDDQNRILIFLTDKVDSKPDGTAYFDNRDKSPSKLNSNGTEIIFASPNKYASNREDFLAELCYALHQMFYYNQRWDTPKVAYYGTEWQSAGLSMLARQKYGNGFKQGNSIDVARVKEYLNKPERIRLDSWPDELSNGNYGMQYLFAQYLYDRCGGKSAVHLLESGQITNVKIGLEDIEMNVLPFARPVCSGLSDFFNDFCLAMYCDNLGLPDSFIGYKANKYEFNSISLQSNGVHGLKGKQLGESPINKVAFDIPAFGCSVLGYNGGNWGDLEFEVYTKPSVGTFKTWVVFYSNEQLKK